jgi:GH24 family phage-related lysozyme (muramidase)
MNNLSQSNTDHTVPQEAIDLIKKFEGYHKPLPDGRAEAYPDPLHGWKIPTIGYGTTRYPDGQPVKRGDVITKEQAEAYLNAHLEKDLRPTLEKIPTWSQMNSNQRAALYSFSYNIRGGANFYGATDRESITKVCDSPDRWQDLNWIKEQFVKYRNPGSNVESGLQERREAEARLFVQQHLNLSQQPQQRVDTRLDGKITITQQPQQPKEKITVTQQPQQPKEKITVTQQPQQKPDPSKHINQEIEKVRVERAHKLR